MWIEENKKAFINAVKQGGGLVVYHHASSALPKDADPGVYQGTVTFSLDCGAGEQVTKSALVTVRNFDEVRPHEYEAMVKWIHERYDEFAVKTPVTVNQANDGTPETANPATLLGTAGRNATLFLFYSGYDHHNH